MILSAQSIRRLCNPPGFIGIRPMVHPFSERAVSHGLSYGLGPAGYDVRIRERVILHGRGGFALASTIEEFAIPADIMPRVMDKSTWARRGLQAFNTTMEPGWCGFLTLELVNHSVDAILIEAGSPIVQIVFQKLDRPTELPYDGKYQHQPAEAVSAIMEQ
jgi:dCTP deaminase